MRTGAMMLRYALSGDGAGRQGALSDRTRRDQVVGGCSTADLEPDDIWHDEVRCREDWLYVNELEPHWLHCDF